MVALQPWFFPRYGARVIERKLIGAVALLAVLIFFAAAPDDAAARTEHDQQPWSLPRLLSQTVVRFGRVKRTECPRSQSPDGLPVTFKGAQLRHRGAPGPERLIRAALRPRRHVDRLPGSRSRSGR